MTPLNGSLELYVLTDRGEEQEVAEMELQREQNLHSAGFELSPEEAESSSEYSQSGQKVRVVYRGEDRIQERAGLWFPQTETAAVICDIEEGPAGPIYTVSNGVLSIAATPDFGSVVHSLKHHGEEWLDSSYPEAAPRSWWNPWHGGLGVGISGIGGFSRLEEPRSAAWTEQMDVQGNVWKGLRITTSIEKQEKNRGIVVNQHYLMLPRRPCALCVAFGD